MFIEKQPSPLSSDSGNGYFNLFFFIRLARTDNQDIAEDTEPIGNVAEHEKSQHGGKNNLRVIVYGNLPRRGAYIRFRYAELSYACERARKYKIKQLQEAHVLILRY